MPENPKTTPRLRAGRIAGIFGLRGELKFDATRIGTDSVDAGTELEATLADGRVLALRVRGLRIHKSRPLIFCDGVDVATAAEALVGATLTIARADVSLDQGEYLDDDLVGCALVDQDGNELARVVSVMHTAAQDLLVLREGASYVPLVAEFVRSIDVNAKKIVVTLPPGLVDSAEAETA